MLGTWTGLMSFELREQMLRLFPETFTVPSRYARHMMVVADLAGDEGAIEDAVCGGVEVAAGARLLTGRTV